MPSIETLVTFFGVAVVLALTPGPEGEPQTNGPRWAWRTDAAPEQEASRGNILIGHSDGGQRLPQLSYPLDLRGPYAVFVRTAPSLGGIALRRGRGHAP